MYNSIRATKKLVAFTLVLALATLSGCSDAGKELAIAAKINIEVQNYVIGAEKAGTIPTLDAKKIIDATGKVGEAGLRAVEIIERVKNNDPTTTTAALDALGIIVDELGKLRLEVVGVKNPTSRHQIEGLLAVIETSLNSARVIIAAKQ